MEECVDGEYQVFKSRDGAFIRKHFFGRYPETAALVEDWSDEKIWRSTRGGHDPRKFTRHTRRRRSKKTSRRDPGEDRQGLRHGRGGRRHDARPSIEEDGRRCASPVSRSLQGSGGRRGVGRVAIHSISEVRPSDEYLQKTRRNPRRIPSARRRKSSATLQAPPLSLFESHLKGSEGREISTTMAFVRI